MSAIQWTHNGSTYRLVGRVRRERERGYVDSSEEHYNVLQVRLTSPISIFSNMSRWRDVEEEYVPSFAWIAKATLGFTDWKSELFEKCRQQFGLVTA